MLRVFNVAFFIANYYLRLIIRGNMEGIHILSKQEIYF